MIGRSLLVLVFVLAIARAAAWAQVPTTDCFWDPVTGRPVVPSGHEYCRTRPSSPPPPRRDSGSDSGRSEGLTDAERRDAARRDADIRRAEQPYREALKEWASGNLNTAIDKLKEAVERARRLPAISPANVAMYRRFNAEYHRLLAERASRNNDFAGAEAFARLARDADPEDISRAEEFDAWLARDREFGERILKLQRRRTLFEAFESGAWGPAIGEARRLLAEEPDDWDGHHVLTQSLLNERRWAEAQDALVAQWRLRPSDGATIANLGLAAARLGSYDAAEALFSEAVGLAPAVTAAKTNLDALRSPGYADRRQARENAVRAEEYGRASFRHDVAVRLQHIDVKNAPPLSAHGVRAGDVLLFAPDGSGSRMSALAEHIYTGRIFGAARPPDVAHVVTVVGRDARGRPLFLDNQPGIGSHVIGLTEFEQRYGARETFVARPQMPLDGAELMRYALERVRANLANTGLGTDYGIFGDDAVCSETAGFAIARASAALRMVDDLGGYLGPIDITPADFLDEKGNGKYFVVMSMKGY